MCVSFINSIMVSDIFSTYDLLFTDYDTNNKHLYLYHGIRLIGFYCLTHFFTKMTSIDVKSYFTFADCLNPPASILLCIDCFLVILRYSITIY